MQNRPKQSDIAKLAGVSQATVSLVISGRADELGITAETRQRILDAVRKLGYVINPVARNLAGGRTRLLGVYTFESAFPIQHRDFYHPFLLGIEEECAARSYDLVLFTSVPDANGRRSIYRDGVSRLRLADGAILLGRDPDRDELARLAREGFPFVFVGRRDVAGVGIPHVTADYAAGVGEVMENLVRLGHRRIVYLGDPVTREAERERERGYHAALERLDLVASRELQWRLAAEELSLAWLETLLSNGATAFFVEEPLTAERVRAALGEIGREVPRDCSVATLTDPLEDTAPGPGWGGPGPGWGGLRVPREAMGRAAVSLLIERLDSGETARRDAVLPCTFIPGRTVAAAASPQHPADA